MIEETARMGLPLLAAGQAYKERSVNEAMTRIDMLLHGCVRSVGADVPPPDAAQGECWIVGHAPGGEWTGHAGALACCTAGGWRFVDPREGMRLWSESDGAVVLRRNGGWRVGEVAARAGISVDGVRVLATRQPAIEGATEGAVQDAEARRAIDRILVVMRTHGLIDG